jgi:hypothetical protein
MDRHQYLPPVPILASEPGQPPGRLAWHIATAAAGIMHRTVARGGRRPRAIWLTTTRRQRVMCPAADAERGRLPTAVVGKAATGIKLQSQG